MKRDFLITVRRPNGKELEPVLRLTEKGANDYADRMLKKYEKGTIVEVGYFTKNLIWTVYRRDIVE